LNKIALLSDVDVRENKILSTSLRNTGIDPSSITYARSIDEISNEPIVVPLGAAAMRMLFDETLPTNKKGDGFINEWRGSVCNTIELVTPSNVMEDYLWRAGLRPKILGSGIDIIPTLAPEMVNKSFDLHPWLLLDLTKISKISRGYKLNRPRREWFVNKPSELSRLLNVEIDEIAGFERWGPNCVRLIAIDTEMNPPIVGICTEDEVHVFDSNMMSKAEKGILREILESPWILKVAHNWSHDHAFIRKQLDIIVARPIFDTYGGAQILNTAMDKDLSPSIATRFTDWPYHKWLTNHDAFLYCGIDTISTFDSYWPIMEGLSNRNLLGVAEHDHRLLTPLLNMQAVGFRVDEPSRKVVAIELGEKVEQKTLELQEIVKPVIKAKIGKFQKPHLFRVKRKCDCCGGGTKQRVHCQTCTIVDSPVDVSSTMTDKEWATLFGFKTIKAWKESLLSCKVCEGTGKIDIDLPFNPDSPDMVADVIYRGLGIRARRYKGKETVKAAQLEAIKDKHLIVQGVVEFSQIRAEADTVERLMPGLDNRLHCVFDPWGPGSGRVASKEGLIEPGTNAQNFPVEARRFVVPDEGYTLLYPDYNAIEARAVALLSGDPKFLAAFKEPIDWPGNPRHGKIDSHTKVMQFLLKDTGVEINRDATKRLTYGSMYGGGVPQMTMEINAEMFRKGLAKRYTTDEIARAMEAFFTVFRGIRQWHINITEEVLHTKKLRCPFTQREFTWIDRVVDKKTKGLKNEIAKQAWSRLPQNMGAWVLANGLIALQYESDAWGSLLQPLVHVHDAPLMQAPTDQLPLAIETAQRYLTRTEWGMYFPTEMKTGSNWLEASGG
jgi:hypothetical protein